MTNHFLLAYQQLDKDNLHLLHEIYTSDVVFVDPGHKIKGLENLSRYFSKLYRDIESITFDYGEIITSDNTASIYWTMTFKHPKISKGKPISTTGNTLIYFNAEGKVNYHRDYFDLGQMLYEHLPLIGKIITYAKKQLAKTE